MVEEGGGGERERRSAVRTCIQLHCRLWLSCIIKVTVEKHQSDVLVTQDRTALLAILTSGNG